MSPFSVPDTEFLCRLIHSSLTIIIIPILQLNSMNQGSYDFAPGHTANTDDPWTTWVSGHQPSAPEKSYVTQQSALLYPWIQLTKDNVLLQYLLFENIQGQGGQTVQPVLFKGKRYLEEPG